MAINTISIKSIVQDIFGCTPLAVMSGMGQCVSRGRAGSTQQQHSSTSCQHQRGAAEDDVTESLNLDTHTNMILEHGKYEDDFDDYDEDFEEADDDVSSDDGDSDCEEASANNSNNNKCAVDNKINNNDPEDNNNCDSGLIMDLVPAYRYGRDDSPRQQKL